MLSLSKMASCCRTLLLFIALVSIGSVWGQSTPDQFVLEENCDSTMPFSESVILFASNLHSVEQCNLVIQSNLETERLLIDITVLDLVDSCSNTSLHILDENGNSIAGPLCEEDNAQVFKAPGNTAQFDYKSDSPKTKGKSLSILITSFNMGVQGKCASIEYQCANKLCIPKDLLCNGYNECSDNSDENDCNGPDYTPLGENAGLIVGVTFACLLAVAVAALCLIRRLRHHRGYDSVN